MVSLQCTMARVNRLTHACVPYCKLTALLLHCALPGMERRKATDRAYRRGGGLAERAEPLGNYPRLRPKGGERGCHIGGENFLLITSVLRN